MKKLAYLAASGALAAGMVVGTTGVASAAHCISPDGESPGYSYFGTDHVKSHDGPEGSKPGHGPTGSPGAENCRSTDRENGTGPADRAPGKA